MACPPSQNRRLVRRPVASDLLIGNPVGHRSTPLSAGRLRMPLLSDFIVHRACAVGKCQYQMTYSCATGIIPPVVICDAGPRDPHAGKGTISSAGNAQPDG